MCQRRAVGGADLEHLGLGSQALGAQLHDGVGAEGVSDLVLAEGAQPHGQGALQLQGGDEDGLVARVNTEGGEQRALVRIPSCGDTSCACVV